MVVITVVQVLVLVDQGISNASLTSCAYSLSKEEGEETIGCNSVHSITVPVIVALY